MGDDGKGGPAGASAALTAAEGGADVILFERGVPRADRDQPGPDSTDAAGMLDYWVDLMDVDPDSIPDDVILQPLEGADFMGPSSSVSIRSTNMPASYPKFGFAFHRARFDDWLRDLAEQAGARYRVGDSVTGVDSNLRADPRHTLQLSSGETVGADIVILADGPQRTVTTGALDQFMPDGRSVADHLAATTANHIAYQEHRKLPEELFEPGLLKFWWGLMPGHTAYPWIFPNDGRVARIGLTMPIGLDIDDYDRSEWALLREDDTDIPRGSVYISRLLEREYPEYDSTDFPLVENRGKQGGTETYPISSTRPIESPTAAGIAVVGGAMGATSAFHEGGDHVAVRTGKVAGELAAAGRLEQYNDAWQAAVGEEIRRNVAMADVVRNFGPADWDRTFRAVERMLNRGKYSRANLVRSGLTGLGLFAKYKRAKFRYRDGRYSQLREADYVV
ncbi:MAG: NAD(P)/FAD-dependent oxidoreductase [Salinirussus sp.]